MLESINHRALKRSLIGLHLPWTTANTYTFFCLCLHLACCCPTQLTSAAIVHILFSPLKQSGVKKTFVCDLRTSFTLGTSGLSSWQCCLSCVLSS